MLGRREGGIKRDKSKREREREKWKGKRERNWSEEVRDINRERELKG
jgi:hypothetical protein